MFFPLVELRSLLCGLAGEFLPCPGPLVKVISSFQGRRRVWGSCRGAGGVFAQIGGWRSLGQGEPLGAGTSRAPLQHTQLLVRIPGQAVAEPAPEPETVQPQQPRMVPHLIKAVERHG